MQEHATTNGIPNNFLLVARGLSQQSVCQLLKAHDVAEYSLKVILPSLRNFSSLHGSGLNTFFVQGARRFRRRRGLFFYWLFWLWLSFLRSNFNIYAWLIWRCRCGLFCSLLLPLRWRLLHRHSFDSGLGVFDACRSASGFWSWLFLDNFLFLFSPSLLGNCFFHFLNFRF